MNSFNLKNKDINFTCRPINNDKLKIIGYKCRKPKIETFKDLDLKVLLTDLMFPNKYAQWRLVEIKSFIDYYQCDILVINRVGHFSGVDYNFDFDILKEKFSLNNYDILIFNPNFNYINIYNNNFDGTAYNKMFKADYLLRHKKNKDNDFKYDLIYHIFLINYKMFNDVFTFPLDKQYIHLYPGGGYFNENSMKDINPQTKIISTQQFISKNIINNKFINNYGGPFFYKDEEVKSKTFTNQNITVCFTSLGDPIEKGANVYLDVAKLYKTTYPNDTIKFVSIGNCPESDYIQHLEKMDQLQLFQYYDDNVDILRTLDSGKGINGFPLGIEAASRGCILLTTDVHNQNVLNDFNIDSFFIINKDDINSIINKIKQINDDINFRIKQSHYIQSKIYTLFNYDNTMVKIFNFISSNGNSIKLKSK